MAKSTVGSLWINIKANTMGLAKGLGKSRGMLGKFGKFAVSPAGMAMVAFAGLTAGIYATVRALTSAVKEFMAFDKAMSEVKSVLLDLSGKQFDGLTNKAKELGATTAHTATQIAEAMATLARAGFKEAGGFTEIQDAIKSVSDLANATGMEMAEASDIIAVGVRAFGLEAIEATRVADVLGLTASKTNTTVAELGEGMKFVAPVAKQLGFSIEETSAMLGKLADAGIKSTMGGTALRKMMLMLGGDIEKHGTKAFFDFMSVQQGVTKNFDKFGARAVTGAGVLQDMAGATAELTRELFGATGAVDEMAMRSMNNLTGDVYLLTSAVSGLQIAVGEELDPTLRELAQSVTLIVNGLQTVFVEFAKSRTATGAVGEIKDAVLSVVKALVYGWSWMKTINSIIDLTFSSTKSGLWSVMFVIAHVVKRAIQILGGALNFFGIISDKSLSGITDRIQSSINNIADGMEGSAKNTAEVFNDAFMGGAFDKGESFYSKIEEQFDGSEKLGEKSGKALGEGLVAGLTETLATPQATDAQMTWMKSAEKLVESLQKQEQAFGKTQAQVLGLQMTEANLHSEMLYTATALEHRIGLLKQQKKESDELKSASESLIESLRTPQQVYDDEESKFQKMVNAKLITTAQMEEALARLRKGTEKDIEVNILTKGIVENLESALGSITISGQVNKAELMAEKTLSVQKNMQSLTEAVKQSTKKTADVLSGTVETEVNGLQEAVTSGVTSATVTANMNADVLEALAEKNNEINTKGFENVVQELKNLATKSSPLT